MAGLLAVISLSVAQLITALPAPGFPDQLVFTPTPTVDTRFDDGCEGPESGEGHRFNLLHHLSGISPYFDSHGSGLDSAPPPGCYVASASYFIRHGNIAANDDEYEETIEPFLKKLESRAGAIDWTARTLQTTGLGFLANWSSPIDKDAKGTGRGLEDLTASGSRDAEAFGKRLRKQYTHLLPHEYTHQEPFNVWSASAKRDIGTATAFINGILPGHPQPSSAALVGSGGDEEKQDRRASWLDWLMKKRPKHRAHVKLIKVNVKEPNWGESLTPHKVCDKFSKSRGKPERDEWRDIYTKPILERLSEGLPDLELEPNDIVGMQQLCGYETVIRGSSPFCKVFTKDEILDFEYYNDVYYYYMMGYAAPFTSALGVPFLITATKKLLNLTSLEPESRAPTQHLLGGPPLPSPTAPPNNTDTPQRLWTYFTHREEPPVVLTALGLFNDSSPLSTTSRDPNRLWRTSNMIPFLGHVALEHLHCNPAQTLSRNAIGTTAAGKNDYIRVVVNTSPRPLDQCKDGPGGSCPAAQWVEWIKDRKEKLGDFKEVCKKDEDDD